MNEKWPQEVAGAWAMYIRSEEVLRKSWERNLKQYEKVAKNAKLVIDKK